MFFKMFTGPYLIFLLGWLLVQAVPGYSTRRALFEQFVRTRAEEVRKEERAAQKAAIDGFKQLLEEVSEVMKYDFLHGSVVESWCLEFGCQWPIKPIDC